MQRMYRFLVFLLAATCVHAADLTVTRPIAPGVEYKSVRRTEGPWEIRVLRISREEPQVHLDTSAGPQLRGVERLSRIIEYEDRPDNYVIAATNGDFFIMGGNPRAGLVIGPMVRRGEVITSGRGRLAFFLTAAGEPGIGELNITGKLRTVAEDAGGNEREIDIRGINQEGQPDSVMLYTRVWGWPETVGCVVLTVKGLPLRTEGRWKATVKEIVLPGTPREPQAEEVLLIASEQRAKDLEKLLPGQELELELSTAGLEIPLELAVGGGPLLMREGQIVPSDNAGEPAHPRTAIGYNDKEIVLVTVDGRQPGWSVGMRLHTLAKLMQELGCTDAMNLDGGGSTTAWVRGEVVNRPSDGDQRSIANAVLVRSRAPRGPLARLIVRPETITALPGAAVPLKLWLTDEAFNPVDADAAAVRAEVLPAGGAESHLKVSWAQGKLTLDGEPGASVVRLSHPGAATATADLRVRIVAQAAYLQVLPDVAHLCVGEEARLSVVGLAEDASELWLPNAAITWRADGQGVEHLGGGLFRATQPRGRAEVRAIAAGAQARAEIRVAFDAPVENFENEPDVRFAALPEAVVSGKVEVRKNGAPEGEAFGRLICDLGEPVGTRAAYLVLNRKLGSALKLSLLARVEGSESVWLRAVVIDGNGSRQYVTLASKFAADGKWRRCEARLPEGIKPPLVWQSVYVVATGGRAFSGWVDVDDLRAARIDEAQ